MGVPLNHLILLMISSVFINEYLMINRKTMENLWFGEPCSRLHRLSCRRRCGTATGSAVIQGNLNISPCKAIKKKRITCEFCIDLSGESGKTLLWSSKCLNVKRVCEKKHAQTAPHGLPVELIHCPTGAPPTAVFPNWFKARHWNRKGVDKSSSRIIYIYRKHSCSTDLKFPIVSLFWTSRSVKWTWFYSETCSLRKPRKSCGKACSELSQVVTQYEAAVQNGMLMVPQNAILYHVLFNCSGYSNLFYRHSGIRQFETAMKLLRILLPNWATRT